MENMYISQVPSSSLSLFDLRLYDTANTIAIMTSRLQKRWVARIEGNNIDETENLLTHPSPAANI